MPSIRLRGVLYTTNLKWIILASDSSLNSVSSEGCSERRRVSVSFSRMPYPTPIFIKLILSIGVRSEAWR